VLLIAAALILYGVKRRKILVPEWWTIGATLSFAAALVYDGALQQIFTHGAANHTEPYYAQGIFPCVWAFALLGSQRSGLLGRAVAMLLLLMSLWIGLNTYVVKLIPFYGGMQGKATLLAVVEWWWHGSKTLLASVVMTDLPVLYVLTGLQALLLIGCGALSLRNMILRGATRVAMNGDSTD
jgi:hypothetical protein